MPDILMLVAVHIFVNDDPNINILLREISSVVCFSALGFIDVVSVVNLIAPSVVDVHFKIMNEKMRLLRFIPSSLSSA